jgi:mannonate dehydratase
MPSMRGQPRLVYQPQMYQRLLDIVPSPNNALELCVGTLGEMSGSDLYLSLDAYSRQRRIAYVHLRNVRGRVPHYQETFIDDGDIDMLRVMSILHRTGFDGVVIPDHAPQMNCPGPWHAGMAHTIGYMLAAKRMLESGRIVEPVA